MLGAHCERRDLTTPSCDSSCIQSKVAHLELDPRCLVQDSQGLTIAEMERALSVAERLKRLNDRFSQEFSLDVDLSTPEIPKKVIRLPGSLCH